MVLAAKAGYSLYGNKPPISAPINWSNSLSRGLVWCTLPGIANRNELVTGKLGTLTGATASWAGRTKWGDAFTSTGDDHGIFWGASEQLYSAQDLTIVMFVRIDLIGPWKRLLTVPYSSSWTSPFNAITVLREGTTGVVDTLRFSWANSETTTTGISADQNTLSQGAHNIIGITKKGLDFRFYREGQLVTAKTSTSTPTIFWGQKRPVYLMSAPVINEGTSGAVYFTAIWNRVLSDAEMKAITLNPLQIIAAPRSLSSLQSVTPPQPQSTSFSSTSNSSSIVIGNIGPGKVGSLSIVRKGISISIRSIPSRTKLGSFQVNNSLKSYNLYPAISRTKVGSFRVETKSSITFGSIPNNTKIGFPTIKSVGTSSIRLGSIKRTTVGSLSVKPGLIIIKPLSIPKTTIINSIFVTAQRINISLPSIKNKTKVNDLVVINFGQKISLPSINSKAKVSSLSIVPARKTISLGSVENRTNINAPILKASEVSASLDSVNRTSTVGNLSIIPGKADIYLLSPRRSFKIGTPTIKVNNRNITLNSVGRLSRVANEIDIRLAPVKIKLPSINSKIIPGDISINQVGSINRNIELIPVVSGKVGSLSVEIQPINIGMSSINSRTNIGSLSIGINRIEIIPNSINNTKLGTPSIVAGSAQIALPSISSQLVIGEPEFILPEFQVNNIEVALQPRISVEITKKLIEN